MLVITHGHINDYCLLTPSLAIHCHDKLRNKLHSAQHVYTDSPQDSVHGQVSVCFSGPASKSTTHTQLYCNDNFLELLFEAFNRTDESAAFHYTCFVVLLLVFLTWVFLSADNSTTNDHHDKARHDST